jgi:hypothetical protein
MGRQAAELSAERQRNVGPGIQRTSGGGFSVSGELELLLKENPHYLEDEAGKLDLIK